MTAAELTAMATRMRQRANWLEHQARLARAHRAPDVAKELESHAAAERNDAAALLHHLRAAGVKADDVDNLLVGPDGAPTS